MRIDKISFVAYQPSISIFNAMQKNDICTFSGKTKIVDGFIPTQGEIKRVIEHLPKSAQDAATTARKDVRDMAMQVVRLVRTGEIKSVEDYKDYMGDFAELGKKIFDLMTPEQKAQSIMLQEKSIEEMQKLKSIAKTSVKEKLLRDLVDAQIQMSQETLKYCKARHQ